MVSLPWGIHFSWKGEIKRAWRDLHIYRWLKRYYTVQYRGDLSGPWQTVNERVEPTVTSYTVHGLKPFTAYQFRIQVKRVDLKALGFNYSRANWNTTWRQAINDIGPSGWSSESEVVRTLPAAPAAGVASVKVIPITTTSVRIVWHPLSEESWNGDAHTAAYRIDYRQITDFPTPALLQGSLSSFLLSGESNWNLIDSMLFSWQAAVKRKKSTTPRHHRWYSTTLLGIVTTKSS